MAPEVRERALGDRSLTSLFSNYAELMKLRVTMLVVATSWCGFFMGALKSEVPALSAQLLETLLGIGLVSGGAAALNQVMERDADSRMRRTQARPLPAGRMSSLHASIFGGTLLIAGSLFLALTTNPLTGYLAFA